MTQEEIKSLQDEVERLTKLHSVKADIISVNAHQIRTSLSAIKWIIRMFISGDLGQLTTEQENLMKRAYEDNDRAIAIVSELLLANKNENIVEKKYEFVKVDIISLIDNCIFDFSGEANAKEIEIIFLKPEKEIPEVTADKGKLLVVIENLLENSIKYSNQHSKIFITAREKEDHIEISVKDKGVGISEEAKSKIFEKFYRDPKAEEKEISGSGIGLYTIKKIVEDHGGKIWFESKENEGATFFFTIPTEQKIKQP